MSAEKVLVFGDDHSPGADLAWGWVCAQAWTGWRAEVVTAEMPPIGPPPDTEAAALHDWEPPSWRHAADTCGFSAVQHLRADADPRFVLGQRSDAALVVVGPTGKGFLKVVHLGSTAEHLLHHLPAPLVIARGEQPVRRVLVAVDGSEHAHRAVETLAALPWVGSVEAVEVVMVSDDDAKAAAELERAPTVLDGVPVTTRRLQSGESIAGSILSAAATIDADLIVMGSRGVGPLKRLLSGSTSTAVAGRAPCSVLMVHAAHD